MALLVLGHCLTLWRPGGGGGGYSDLVPTGVCR